MVYVLVSKLMNAKEKLERANLLIDTYGSLLTKKQLSVMKDKYQFDLSLQEIAVNNKISRQGVDDTIKVSYKKLEEYESKLHLIKKKNEVLSIIKDNNLKKKVKSIL